MVTTIQSPEVEPDTLIQTDCLPSYVERDDNGNPIWYTVEEWFDVLDKKLIGHFGEEFRQLSNESRIEWNKRGPWKFDML
ncbi:hypothetical protein AGMMS4957_11310 [Bacteroidia bacterium]|nr:hypothetical protein AGMMS4957_11310 [Bacteroidia bacterium]